MKTVSFDPSLHLGSVMYLASASRAERFASMPDEPDLLQATDRFLELLLAERIAHVRVGGLAIMATLSRHCADHHIHAIGELLTDIRRRLKPRFSPFPHFLHPPIP